VSPRRSAWNDQHAAHAQRSGPGAETAAPARSPCRARGRCAARRPSPGTGPRRPPPAGRRRAGQRARRGLRQHLAPPDHQGDRAPPAPRDGPQGAATTVRSTASCRGCRCTSRANAARTCASASGAPRPQHAPCRAEDRGSSAYRTRPWRPRATATGADGETPVTTPTTSAASPTRAGCASRPSRTCASECPAHRRAQSAPARGEPRPARPALRNGAGVTRGRPGTARAWRTRCCSSASTSPASTSPSSASGSAGRTDGSASSRRPHSARSDLATATLLHARPPVPPAAGARSPARLDRRRATGRLTPAMHRWWGQRAAATIVGG
jgi:hypothetical protein